jgi:uncharacterized membrane protein HdeD (DUF308 family)
MALTRKDYLISALYVLIALFLVEIGVLSVYVAIAYSSSPGAVVAAFSGIFLIILGGALLVSAKRRFARKG